VKPLLLGPYAFLAAARRARKRCPRAPALIAEAARRLRVDPYDPVLETHHLGGRLEGSWAARAGEGLWLVFRLVEHQGSEAILLETVGEHVDTVDAQVSVY